MFSVVWKINISYAVVPGGTVGRGEGRGGEGVCVFVSKGGERKTGKRQKKRFFSSIWCSHILLVLYWS